jgi:hypothetical protein
MLCALLDFDCNIAIKFEIFGQPHRRKMAPTQLLDNDVAIKQDFTNMNRVIATYFVVGHALVFARIVVVKKLVVDDIF